MKSLTHVLGVARALAFLPPLAATTVAGCSTGFPPSCDLMDQTQGATVTGGAAAPASAAAQCANPGPDNSACAEAVTCGPRASCCGRWVCGPATTPDAGTGLVWTRQLCEGPLAPPESAA
jgi:hypothetical protein